MKDQIELQALLAGVILDEAAKTSQGRGPLWSTVVRAAWQKVNQFRSPASRSWCEAKLLEVRRLMRDIGLVDEDGRERVLAIFRTKLGELVRRVENRHEYLVFIFANYKDDQEELTTARVLFDLCRYELCAALRKAADTQHNDTSCECKERIFAWHAEYKMMMTTQKAKIKSQAG